MLKQAVTDFRATRAVPGRRAALAVGRLVLTRFVWDDESQDVLSARHVELGRQTGVLAGLPIALNARVCSTFAGEFTAAATLIEELLTLTDAMRIPMQLNGRWCWPPGAAGKRRRPADRRRRQRGRARAARAAGWPSPTRPPRCWPTVWAAMRALTAAAATDASTWTASPSTPLSELIEAAARAGAAERAAAALRRLAEMTQASGTDWGPGMRARAEALLSAETRPRRLYREAIERLGRTRVRVELAALTCSTASGCAARPPPPGRA